MRTETPTVTEREARRLERERKSQMLSANGAAMFLGMGRTTFFRARKLTGFPKPVRPIWGGKPLYRREDLAAWVANLETVEDKQPEPPQMAGRHGSTTPARRRKVDGKAMPQGVPA